MTNSSATILVEQVKKLNEQWMQSYVKRDLDFLEQYVSEEYVSTFPDGTVLDKRREIELLQSGGVVFASMQAREMNVRVYGETAVITGQSAISATVKGHGEIGEFRFTDVWAKQGGRWRAFASQVTRITRRAA